MAKPFVFVSYCQRDAAYRDELVEAVLKPAHTQGHLDFWYDQALVPGDEHEVEIMANLARADVAICLVSAPFVSSWFIQNKELPFIMEAHSQGRMRVIWFLLWPLELALVGDLAKIQAAVNPSTPLLGMSEYERHNVYKNLCTQLIKLASAQAQTAGDAVVLQAEGSPQAPVPPCEVPRGRRRERGDGIEIVSGDLAEQAVDVVIVSASSNFRGTSGLEQAMHAAAGPHLKGALRGQRKLGVAEAIVTPGFASPARALVHALAPRWKGNPRQDLVLLHETYNRAFDAAIREGARTVALGSLGTGNKGFPAEVSAAIAIEAAQRAIARGPDDFVIRFVVQNPVVLAALQEARGTP